MDETRLDDDALMALAVRLEELPPEHMDWVVQLFLECQRARAAETHQNSGGCDPGSCEEVAQIALDTAQWLRTLWEVGYMGSEAFPARPRTEFPQVTVEDIVKSALFARIRQGKAPLPFPPPTRDGVPWHEVVESDQTFLVRARVVDGAAIVEGCADWQVVAQEEIGRRLRIQHRGKGPIYHLTLRDGDCAELRRCPAEVSRRILRQSRGGIDAYLLEWPKDDGGAVRTPLRAASWDRAESEAHRWVALRHPQLYGQIHFERSEA